MFRTVINFIGVTFMIVETPQTFFGDHHYVLGFNALEAFRKVYLFAAQFG